MKRNKSRNKRRNNNKRSYSTEENPSSLSSFKKSKKKKTNNNDDKNKKDHQHHEATTTVPNSSIQKSSLTTTTTYNNNSNYPPPFPSEQVQNLPPPTDFLRDVQPYKSAYRLALNTSYQGLAIDLPSKQQKIVPHDIVKKALETMDTSHLFFKRDVTQPFGLGTKCAPTYVTRCLLGEKGTTYKYLGLRMFARPWDGSGIDDSSTTENNEKVKEAVQAIQNLNTILTTRTAHHLSSLYTKRDQSKENQQHGRAKFDIALINKMICNEHLKREPTTNQGKCAVSWHADSCLEHFSTIAVYHTIFHDDNYDETENIDRGKKNGKERQDKEEKLTGWSVALRVAHDSEGPRASRRGTSIESSVINNTPSIATSLPSGSIYYLLDDFNHHHQHAVIANDDTKGIRFSSTHRLLRHGHNVHHIIEKCYNTIKNNQHKKGWKKVWKTEQLVLDELESEWIRQFYVQGRAHRDNLWKSWEEPICTLLKYWSQLEIRTKQTIDLLQFAAEEKCGFGSSVSSSSTTTTTPPRAERKKREKRKKAAIAIRDILKRGGDSAVAAASADQTLYEPLAQVLEERATMRQLWNKREHDFVFRKMEEQERPLPVPFHFDVVNVEEVMSQQKKKQKKNGMGSSNVEMGYSNLGGSPEQLRSLADKIRQWGKAYVSCNISDLPIDDGNDCNKLDNTVDTTKNDTTGGKETEQDKSSSIKDDHSKDLNWQGWDDDGNRKFGLEMQHPWAGYLLDGRKTIETRVYDLPPSLVGKRIEILESQSGKDGISSIGNVVPGGEEAISRVVKRVGWCTFDRVVVYEDRATFEADEDEHMVQRESGYGWKDGRTKKVFGWVVGKCARYDNEGDSKAESCQRPRLVRIVRRLRSLFELQFDDDNSKIENKPAGKKRMGKNFHKRGKKRQRGNRHEDVEEDGTCSPVKRGKTNPKKRKKRF